MSVRLPAVAGLFYPADATEVRMMIDGMLRDVKAGAVGGTLRAIVVPHAGYIYSGTVAAHAYALTKDQDFKNVIILGPSHHVYLHGFASDPHEQWSTPLGKVDVIPSTFAQSAIAHRREHSIEVQVPFIQAVLPNARILPLVFGDADVETAADEIESMLDDDTLLVVSSDLSHYHSYDDAKRIDAATLNAIMSLDRKKIVAHGDACGRVPVQVLMEIAKRKKWKPTVLCAMNSGDTAGGKRNVVGYASIAFTS
ncbi:MAG: AmmeMemoRadiSam system protein B [Nanoarchaeota archaeon]